MKNNSAANVEICLTETCPQGFIHGENGGAQMFRIKAYILKLGEIKVATLSRTIVSQWYLNCCNIYYHNSQMTPVVAPTLFTM